MSIIDTVTVEDFKEQFKRFTPSFLPVYQEGKTYFNGDTVYYNELFYTCIVEHTTSVPSDGTEWKLVNQDVLNYTCDEDITKAFNEAKINFNENLFDDEQAKLIFLYLTAYYLTFDLQNATGTVQTGIVTSKSVGSVSQSYGIPQWVLQDKVLGAYSSNGYGLKYLSLLRPYLIGNVMFCAGGITID